MSKQQMTNGGEQTTAPETTTIASGFDALVEQAQKVAVAAPKSTANRSQVDAFVLNAIKVLRKHNKPYLLSDGTTTVSKGIHTVISHFNEYFRQTFPGLDPIKETARMAAEGKIGLRMVKRGAMIFLPEDQAPAKAKKTATMSADLAEILLAAKGGK